MVLGFQTIMFSMFVGVLSIPTSNRGTITPTPQEETTSDPALVS
jgi:hypothetical protein